MLCSHLVNIDTLKSQMCPIENVDESWIIYFSRARPRQIMLFHENDPTFGSDIVFSENMALRLEMGHFGLFEIAVIFHPVILLHVWNYPFSNAFDIVGIPRLRNRVMQPKPCTNQMSCYTTVGNNNIAFLLKNYSLDTSRTA